MPKIHRNFLSVLALALPLQAAWSDEAQIRKNLVERLPNFPTINEVTKTSIPGLYEIRMGTEIVYSDEQGDHVIQGNLIDTRTRTNITDERVTKLTTIDFATLPLKDAIVWKSGTGARRMVVFSDPNCGYCKRLERDIQQVKNVTVYTFLYPILGDDSTEKSRDIWCAKDPTKAWLAWMLEGKSPPKADGACNVPLDRNIALGRKYRVNGTPAVVFVDGSRAPGAMSAEEIEKRLLSSAKP